MLPASVMRGNRAASASPMSALAATTSRARAKTSGRCASAAAGTLGTVDRGRLGNARDRGREQVAQLGFGDAR